MAPNEIRKFIDARPFAPFRIYLSDGNTIEVRDPSYIAVTRFSVMVGEDYDEHDWPTTGRHVNIRQITQIETLPSAA